LKASSKREELEADEVFTMEILCTSRNCLGMVKMTSLKEIYGALIQSGIKICLIKEEHQSDQPIQCTRGSGKFLEEILEWLF
jgi:hypothetical protein